jgi:hypothetical protein
LELPVCIHLTFAGVGDLSNWAVEVAFLQLRCEAGYTLPSHTKGDIKELKIRDNYKQVNRTLNPSIE